MIIVHTVFSVFSWIQIHFTSVSTKQLSLSFLNIVLVSDSKYSNKGKHWRQLRHQLLSNQI